jgi:hypothetical protein
VFPAIPSLPTPNNKYEGHVHKNDPYQAFIFTLSAELYPQNMSTIPQSSEAYQDSDVLDKVAPIQVATYAIF